MNSLDVSLNLFADDSLNHVVDGGLNHVGEGGEDINVGDFLSCRFRRR